MGPRGKIKKSIIWLLKFALSIMYTHSNFIPTLQQWSMVSIKHWKLTTSPYWGVFYYNILPLEVSYSTSWSIDPNNLIIKFPTCILRAIYVHPTSKRTISMEVLISPWINWKQWEIEDETLRSKDPRKIP
jgi:hypothetical protein